MKAHEIRKVATWTKGWLCVDKGRGAWPISFFISKPGLGEDGVWSPVEDNYGLWDRDNWRDEYGSASLPKPGACERVKLEL